MKWKKVIAIVVTLTIIVGAVGGGIYGYKSYQKKKLVAEVQLVSNLNWGYWGDSQTSYGMVTNDSSQEVYLDNYDKVAEVYVEAGDTVKKGDPLVKYDAVETELDIKRKKLDVSIAENDLAKANHKLELLKKMKPVPERVEEESEEPLPDVEETEDTENTEDVFTDDRGPELDAKDKRIYNYLTENAVPYNADTADGSPENPYTYYCNKDAYIYGSFFNSIRPQEQEDGTFSEGKCVQIIVCKKNIRGKMVLGKEVLELPEEPVEETEEVETKSEPESGEPKPGVVASKNRVPLPDTSVVPNTKKFDGNNLPTVYDAYRRWDLFTGLEVEDLPEEPLEDEDDAFDEWEGGYTAKELAEMIYDKQEEIKKKDIERRKLELQLETLENSVSDGIVYAKMDGVVKSVGSLEEDNGEAFITISGEGGLYVSGTISELLLDTVKPGMVVTANSWESGMTFDATITEISEYPTSEEAWGEGNPNVSYYAYTAYMDDSSALNNGEYVDLSINTNMAAGGEGLYIEKAYVRQENGRSYVMMADENNRLKKQYVETGKTIYGSAIEIKSGLSGEDRIAFPYGKMAVEGAAVTDDGMSE